MYEQNLTKARGEVSYESTRGSKHERTKMHRILNSFINLPSSSAHRKKFGKKKKTIE